MNQKIAQLAEVKRFAAGFRSLLAVSEQLAEIGSIEQAADDAQRRLDLLKAEEDKARSEAAAVEAAAQTRANQIEKEGRDAAERAGKQAEAVLADAHARAAEIVSRAEAEAMAAAGLRAREAEAAERLATSKQADLALVEHAIEEKIADHDKLNALIAAARAELAELQGHIAAVKAKFS